MGKLFREYTTIKIYLIMSPHKDTPILFRLSVCMSQGTRYPGSHMIIFRLLERTAINCSLYQPGKLEDFLKPDFQAFPIQTNCL